MWLVVGTRKAGFLGLSFKRVGANRVIYECVGWMSGIQNLETFDPFADAAAASVGATQSQIHIRVQQRNGRKCITHVQGLDPELDFKSLLKRWKRSFCCNGSLQRDEDGEPIVQMSGDQRQAVRDDLVKKGICESANIVLH